jgi:hypothetical protein
MKNKKQIVIKEYKKHKLRLIEQINIHDKIKEVILFFLYKL